MNINKLISTVKNKIRKNIILEDLIIEDKTFLHKNHKSHTEGKFHIKLTIKSEELKILTKIQSTKKIYKILDVELKKYIHSIQVLVN
ncbi:BolA/IbaG family iron-sulfur metabolism protein [Candidatus Pelagibacter sp.]|nr:BolA/IbaG family iron-sulfur metabolism protein [Candidatus Pelagibacter sp.]